MRGFSDIAVLVLLLLFAVTFAWTLFGYLTALFSYFSSGNETSAAVLVPPVPIASKSEVNIETGHTELCVLLKNVESQNVPITGAKLVVNGETTFVLDAYSPDCNDYIPGDGLCTICGKTSAPPGEHVTVSILFPNTSASTETTVTVDASKYYLPDPAITSLSFSNLLSFAPPHPDRYDSVLFFGDHNAAVFYVEVNNFGQETAEFNVVLFGPCIQDVWRTVALSPGESTILALETNTTDANFSCSVTASIDFAADQRTTSNDSRSVSAPVHYVDFCVDKPSCESALAGAVSRTDANTVVLLAGNIQSAFIFLAGYDFGWRVTFDGNSNEINNSGGWYALYLDSVDHISIRNVRLLATYYTLYLQGDISVLDSTAEANTTALYLVAYSTASIHDSNIHASNAPLYLEAWSYIPSASNAYCFFSGDPTPYPILSISVPGSDLNISAYLEQNTPGSPAICHVSILADGVKIHDGNVGVEKDGNYISAGAIVVFEANDVNIYRVNATARYSALSLYSSSALVSNSNVFASDDAAYVSCPSCIADLNIDMSEGNVYITSPGYDWDVHLGTLNVHCYNCGTYCLDTNFDDGYGTINQDPDANCLACICG